MDIVSSQENKDKKTQIDSRKRQNIIFGALLFVGSSALILGIFQISKTITSPLAGSDYQDVDDSTLVNDDPDYQQLVFLKGKDTDQDGLNDYDELNIYETSPYVADSDSDNISDKEELDSGNDPNCPKGKTCVITTAETDPTANSNNNSGATAPEISSAELRATLKEIGAPANIVDAMDDATLRSVYQETVIDTGIDLDDLTGNTNSGAPTESAGQEITVDALQKLDAAQIRQLLISSGISESELSQVDDETLVLLYSQVLQEQL
ncbi:MAG: hypothetical protein WCW66_03040 [Patescibacteria group bacterium]